MASNDVVYNIDFTVNEFITLTQNARLASNAPMVALNIDYSLTLEVADLTNLFRVTYQQNAANAEMYDIDVSMNPVLLETYISAATANWAAAKVNAAVVTSGLTASNELPKAILETIALRVFGSGNARAAIVNDSSIDAEVLSHKTDFLNVLTNKKDDLFRAYVDSGRIAPGDVTEAVTMNLANTHISFPMWVTGSLLSPTGNVLSIYPYADGYASYGGFGTMADGAYNVPIIVKFHQS
jgi:hypothetical protein